MTHYLFDKKDRDPMAPGLYNETHYSLYDRSGHPDSERVRNMLERWVDRFPDTKRKDIVSRMRSKDFDSFDQAFFETFLHEFLQGTGATVTHEPDVAGRKPEFAVSDGKFNYVVEATSLMIQELKGKDRNELQALDWLNAIHAPWYTLWTQTYGVLDPMISKRKLLGPFEKLVEDADYEHLRGLELSNDANQLEKVPSKTVTHGDWKITGRLRRTVRRRRAHEGFWGGGQAKAATPDDIGMIRKTLKSKAKQCAGAEKAVIAIEFDEHLQFRIPDALFGTNITTLRFNKESGEIVGATPDQLKDGFWFDKHSPQHQRVIGIIFFTPVRPWSIKNATALFVSNPYIKASLPEWTREITHVDFGDGEWKIMPGKPIADFMKDYEDVLQPGNYYLHLSK